MFKSTNPRGRGGNSNQVRQWGKSHGGIKVSEDCLDLSKELT